MPHVMQVVPLNCTAAGGLASDAQPCCSLSSWTLFHSQCCTLRPVGAGEHLPSPPPSVLSVLHYPLPIFSQLCVLNRSATIIDQGRSIATNLVSGRLEPVLFSLGRLNITLFVVECVFVHSSKCVCVSIGGWIGQSHWLWSIAVCMQMEQFTTVEMASKKECSFAFRSIVACRKLVSVFR